MIDLLSYLRVVRQSDQDITRAADGAFKRLIELIRAGQTPQKAISQALREFNADTLVGLEKALSEVLESSLGQQAIRDWKVGDVKLSDRLYQNAQQVSATTKAIITEHMKSVHRAEDLRKALYEGYDFQVDPLNVNAPLPKYLQVEFDRFKAMQLKTPALRAAYLEAIKKAESGAGMDALEKRLRIAFYERNRYFANRIARTELHRNYTEQQARDLMSQDRIEYVQVRLSAKHPKVDICDFHTRADLYGLGPGIYPKASAPLPPYHPHCYCLVSPVVNLINPKPKFKPNAERTFLRTLPAKEAAQVTGSVEKKRRILEDSETLEGIYNEGKDPLYQWKKLGTILDTVAKGRYSDSIKTDGRNKMATKRLESAATYIEKLIADAVKAGEADDTLVTEGRRIASAMRATTRTDLDKGVWASVFSALKIKGDLARGLALELEQAEGKLF